MVKFILELEGYHDLASKMENRFLIDSDNEENFDTQHVYQPLYKNLSKYHRL
jgi:hypothetical protein